MISTPWWATALLMLAASALTHFLTGRRERAKARKEQLDRWREDALSLLRQISDDSTTHYLSKDSIANTVTSSALIVGNLKRLQNCLSETVALNTSDSQATARAFRSLNDCISGEPDFQNPRRARRKKDDPIVSRIQQFESDLTVAIKSPRSMK